MGRKNKIRWKRLLLLTVCIYAVVHLLCGLGEIHALKEQRADIDEQMSRALSEQEKLSEQLELAASGSEMERIAREKLGYVLPGEVLLKKVEVDNSSNR